VGELDHSAQTLPSKVLQGSKKKPNLPAAGFLTSASNLLAHLPTLKLRGSGIVKLS